MSALRDVLHSWNDVSKTDTAWNKDFPPNEPYLIIRRADELYLALYEDHRIHPLNYS